MSWLFMLDPFFPHQLLFKLWPPLQCLSSVSRVLHSSRAKEGSKESRRGGPQKGEEEIQTPPFILGQKGGVFCPLPYSFKVLQPFLPPAGGSRGALMFSSFKAKSKFSDPVLQELIGFRHIE